MHDLHAIHFNQTTVSCRLHYGIHYNKAGVIFIMHLIYLAHKHSLSYVTHVLSYPPLPARNHYPQMFIYNLACGICGPNMRPEYSAYV